VVGLRSSAPLEPAAEDGASVNGQGREQDVAKKSKVPEGQRPLVAIISTARLQSDESGDIEAEAMVRLANAVAVALEDIKSPHWRRLLEPLRERLCAAAVRRAPSPRRLSATQ
jgi:hypothetical protein